MTCRFTKKDFVVCDDSFDFTRIEKYRKDNKITTRKMANLVGLTPSAYCDYKFNRKKVDDCDRMILLDFVIENKI